MSSKETEIEDVREVPAEIALTSVLQRAEVDQQIATAKKYPRSIKRFIEQSVSMATLDEDVAAECIYALPRKERDPITGKQVTKMIEGPSARLAEIAAHAWGNCRIAARVTEEGREFVTAQGTFHDLEANTQLAFEVKRRITTKRGDRFSADMIVVTGNAAASIALRNAVFKGIPKAFWNKIYAEARRVVAGDAKTLANRRSDALAFLQKLGATPEMVFATLDVQGVEDIDLDKLATLRAMATAIKEGETTVEEAFAGKSSEPPGDDQSAKNKSAPAAGSTSQKARDALKPKAPAAPDAAAIEALKKTSDKAGVAETALLKRYDVDKLEALSGEQYQDAMRFCAGLLSGENVPA